MPCASAVMIFAAFWFIAASFSALVAVLPSLLVPTAVPAFGYTTAPSLALARGLSFHLGSRTMSLDPSASASPMVLYNISNTLFAEWFTAMSCNPDIQGYITLPPFIQITTIVKELCTHVFPRQIIQQAHVDHRVFTGRSILAMRNDTVSEFNDIVLNEIIGETQSFYSSDTADFEDSPDRSNELPAEYLQSLNPAGIPPSELKLKIGAPIILLSNPYPKQGLYNGTRMTVTKMARHCIEVRILGGDFDGQIKIIPRIKLSTTEEELSFILTRKQLPIRLCFAMTVNKAQGQSLNVVGIDLRQHHLLMVSYMLHYPGLPVSTI
ncbi:uncharacterized protein H6S33_001193 [Morchella sextelata]|uniref:uncharacterized protein n=1 Tax=Morchella sextelata TaxID=1174677 RepID=UPI001D03DA56|nr:uncharacterized protein H6S33_001193 [Morchella sextelata]KAH0608965.1 hypothetical protein H6S33_001193 [Morchella sextelata]